MAQCLQHKIYYKSKSLFFKSDQRRNEIILYATFDVSARRMHVYNCNYLH